MTRKTGDEIRADEVREAEGLLYEIIGRPGLKGGGYTVNTLAHWAKGVVGELREANKRLDRECGWARMAFAFALGQLEGLAKDVPTNMREAIIETLGELSGDTLEVGRRINEEVEQLRKLASAGVDAARLQRERASLLFALIPFAVPTDGYRWTIIRSDGHEDHPAIANARELYELHTQKTEGGGT